MTLGDSKTASNAWEGTLVASLRTRGDSRHVLLDRGTQGATVAIGRSLVDGQLAALPSDDLVTGVWINFGANDVGGALDETTWKADLTYIVNAVRAKYLHATVYTTRPWRRGYDAQCNAIAAWIVDVEATLPFMEPGDDERVWLKGADDGATNTTDGIHYSTAGQAAASAVKLTAMGY